MHVATGTDREEVDGRDEHGTSVSVKEVREGEGRQVGVTVELAHDHGESPDASAPHEVAPDAVLHPRSSSPWCSGPSLYMWLLMFVPEPALKNELMLPISKVDL